MTEWKKLGFNLGLSGEFYFTGVAIVIPDNKIQLETGLPEAKVKDVVYINTHTVRYIHTIDGNIITLGVRDSAGNVIPSLSESVGSEVNVKFGHMNIYGQMIQDMIPFFTDVRTKISAFESQKTEVFNRADQLYSEFYTGTLDKIESVIDATLNDISNAGAKFLVLKPFAGYLHTLRYTIIDTISSKYPNYPKLDDRPSYQPVLFNISGELTNYSEVTVNSTGLNILEGDIITVVFSSIPQERRVSGVVETLISTKILLSQRLTDTPLESSVIINTVREIHDSTGAILMLLRSDQYTKAFVDMLNIVTTYFKGEDVGLSAFGEILNSPLNTAFRKVLESDYITNTEGSLGKVFRSSNNIVDDLNATPTDINAITEKLYNDVSLDYANSMLAFLGGDLSAVLSNLNPFKKVTSDIQNYATKLMNQVPFGLPIISSGDIKPNYIYKVNSFEGEIFSIIYNGVTYESSIEFTGLLGITEYIVSPGISVESGYVSLEKVETSLDRMGKLFTGGFNSLYTGEYYDRWIDLLSIDDLAGGGLKSVIDLTKGAVELTGKTMTEVGDTIMSGVKWLEGVSSVATNKGESVVDNTLNILNNMPSQIEGFNAEMLIIPPERGGLNRIRFAFSEWIREEAPNSPEITNLNIFLPVVIVYNDATVIERFLTLFKGGST